MMNNNNTIVIKKLFCFERFNGCNGCRLNAADYLLLLLTDPHPLRTAWCGSLGSSTCV